MLLSGAAEGTGTVRHCTDVLVRGLLLACAKGEQLFAYLFPVIIEEKLN